jgi:hypothetical protein
LIRSYRIRLNKKDTLTGKEKKELEMIETVADILNSSIPSTGNTLDKFL